MAALAALLALLLGPLAVQADPGFLAGPPTIGGADESTIVEVRGILARIDGEFADGTAERLAALLRAHPEIRILELTSEGGYVDEGVEIGMLAVRHGLVTYVPDYCISACTLAFARGSERLAAPEAKLGFHGPCDPCEPGAEVQVDPAAERQAYLDAGVAADFVEAALAVPPADIWFPPPDRLIQARLVTRFSSPLQALARAMARPRTTAGQTASAMAVRNAPP